MVNEFSKFITEAFSAFVMIIIAIALLQEISNQSELIRSLSFLFYALIFASIIAVIVKIKDIIP